MRKRQPPPDLLGEGYCAAIGLVAAVALVIAIMAYYGIR